MRVADHIAARLQRAGVRHVFGVGGANIEDLFAAIQRRQPELRVLLTKHEHGAGTAADAYARIGGGLGVVLATSGGGAMNLVHALAEARGSGAYWRWWGSLRSSCRVGAPFRTRAEKTARSTRWPCFARSACGASAPRARPRCCAGLPTTESARASS